MKRLLAALVLLALPALADAANCTVLNAGSQTGIGIVYELANATAVAGNVTVSTSCIDMAKAGFFGLWYQCTSVSGAPNIDLVWQEGYDREATRMVNVVTVHDDLVAETATVKQVSPPPMMFGRLSIVGNVTNPSDALCTIHLVTQGGMP